MPIYFFYRYGNGVCPLLDRHTYVFLLLAHLLLRRTGYIREEDTREVDHRYCRRIHVRLSLDQIPCLLVAIRAEENVEFRNKSMHSHAGKCTDYTLRPRGFSTEYW